MLNKAQIIGHLGNDPDTKYTQSGMAVTNISVATTEKWKDNNGDQQERTEWHRVTFFGKLAEIAGEYLRKGGQVYVEGKLQTEKWTDKDGVERYTTKIIGSEMRMLGGKPANDNGGQRRDDTTRQQRPPQRQERQAAPQQQRPAPMDDFSDDDVPF